MLAARLETQLQSIQCGSCGVWHAIPKTMYDDKARIGGYWHCPNGHQRGWEKGTEHTRIKELEAQVEEERKRKVAALERANASAQQLTAACTQLKGTKTRLKNVKHRVADGVCPCCNRTFLNLQRHMAIKHPEFKTDGT